LANVVGVRFRRAGKIYHFSPGKLELKSGQNVIVETSRGLEYGEVVQENKVIADKDVVSPLRQILRITTEADNKLIEDNKRQGIEALKTCQEKVEKHNLEMKLVDVEYTFDHNKIIFYFTSEGRVDFRELVKDLASVFRMRIELRQIGVRDEAKIVGGMGSCGRGLCCATFLEDFGPVSIRMAKEQNLSLNPTKISGICGRLMCCLRYEAEQYEMARGETPSPGEIVITPQGDGKVISVNRMKKTLIIEMNDDSRQEEFSTDEVDRKGT